MKARLAQAYSCCVYVKPQKIIQRMHAIILYMLDCCSSPSTKELHDISETVVIILPTCLAHLACPEIMPDPDEAELSLDMSEMSSESNAESLSGLSIVVVDVVVAVDAVEMLLACWTQ